MLITQLPIPDNVSFKDTRELYILKLRPSLRKVRKADYFAILSDFMAFIVELVFQGHRVSLPNRCGELYIVGRRIDIENQVDLRNYGVDWKKTKELWAINEQAKQEKKLVKHLNEGTSQTLYKFKWDSSLSKLTHVHFYKFTLARDNKRKLAEIIKEGQEYHAPIIPVFN